MNAKRTKWDHKSEHGHVHHVPKAPSEGEVLGPLACCRFPGRRPVLDPLAPYTRYILAWQLWAALFLISCTFAFTRCLLACCFCRRLIRTSLSPALARSAGLLLVRFDTRYGWFPVSLRGARISGLPACRECLFSYSAVHIHFVMHSACSGGVWGRWCGLSFWCGLFSSSCLGLALQYCLRHSLISPLYICVDSAIFRQST